MFVVKVPGINSNGEPLGCENSGNLILESLKKIYSNEEGKIIDSTLLDLEEIHLDNSKHESSNRLIYENALDIFETKPRTIFLGGDHSITYPLANAFLEYCKKQRKDPCLIVFDAHSDCINSSNPTTPSNKEWLRTLIGTGFPNENILLVGTRNQRASEIEFLSKKKIRVITMNQLLEDLGDSCDIIMEFSSGKDLYLSFDIDVIDPAFAPATANPEFGGLTPRQFIYLIQRFNKIKRLKALDIVEINSKMSGGQATINLGAKILSEFL